jgi:hypothetical protein
MEPQGHTHQNIPRWDLEGIERKYSIFEQNLDSRIPVYFIHDANSMYLPLALGMMYAQVRQSIESGRLTDYNLLPVWDFSVPQIARLGSKCGPAVWLFSDYLWTLESNLWLSKQIKLSSPQNVVIHGGPSAPNYEDASRLFLRSHPEVDILVRGEGEVTIVELLACLAPSFRRAENPAIEGVEGIIFSRRSDNRVIRTADRTRARLEDMASPYLGGFFDDYGAPVLAATIETNRGCPYGCTFCDWGSATLQKIRNFDLDRVKAEIDWVSRHRIKILWIADANFGIFDRDVEIAEYIAASRMKWDYPKQVVVNYAKNATKRIAEIVKIFSKSGVSGQGIIAIQTTDESTLKVIRRTNIKSERYDELTEIFEREHLPLSTDLIAGLPGSTVKSFKGDLQHYFDRRVAVKVYESILLPNSPMADPDYMKKYQIEVDNAGNVVATSTFSKEEKLHMMAVSKAYNLFVEYGLLRYVLFYLQWTQGLRSVDVIEQFVRTAERASFEFPILSWLALNGWPKPMPPAGWPAFYDEVRSALVRLGVEPDDELAVVMEVNKSVMPGPNRTFPDVIHLPFDFVQYFREHISPAGSERRLSEYESGTLTVADPQNLCVELFANTFLYGLHTIHWELDSELHSSAMIPKLNQAFEIAAPSLVV